MKKPNFFIVGAPKCGTHAMHNFLKVHPEIYMPEKKEFQYFATDLVRGTPFELTESEYLSYFQGATNEKRLGEASTWYLYSKEAALNIKRFNPCAKIIIMLRNPVDMMYAYWLHLLYYGHEEVADFKKAVDLEECRKVGKHIPKTLKIPVQMLFYKEIAKFGDQVERYLKVFGQENVHIILQERFKEDPEHHYKKVLEFLEVNPNFTPEFSIIYPRKKPRSLILNKLLNHPPLFLRLCKNIIPITLRRSLSRIIRSLNTQINPPDKVAPEIRRELLAFFREDIEKLMELTKMDLSHWLDVKEDPF